MTTYTVKVERLCVEHSEFSYVHTDFSAALQCYRDQVVDAALSLAMVSAHEWVIKVFIISETESNGFIFTREAMQTMIASTETLNNEAVVTKKNPLTAYNIPL